MLLLVHLFFLLGSVCMSLNVVGQVGKPVIKNKLGATSLPSASKKQTENKPAPVRLAISQNGTGNKKEQASLTPPPKMQNHEAIEEKVYENTTFDKVDIEASFPGGDNKWRQYLERNANGQVAADNGAPKGTYTVLVQFVVDKEGNISDVQSLTNHGYGMEEEGIRIIRKGPMWNPAIQNGRQVKAYRRQPITFRVDSE
jgi:hypothetical protein